MPFASRKQQRFMWLQHPDIARKWTDDAKREHQPTVRDRRKKQPEK